MKGRKKGSKNKFKKYFTAGNIGTAVGAGLATAFVGKTIIQQLKLAAEETRKWENFRKSVNDDFNRLQTNLKNRPQPKMVVTNIDDFKIDRTKVIKLGRKEKLAKKNWLKEPEMGLHRYDLQTIKSRGGKRKDMEAAAIERFGKVSRSQRRKELGFSSIQLLSEF